MNIFMIIFACYNETLVQRNDQEFKTIKNMHLLNVFFTLLDSPTRMCIYGIVNSSNLPRDKNNALTVVLKHQHVVVLRTLDV